MPRIYNSIVAGTSRTQAVRTEWTNETLPVGVVRISTDNVAGTPTIAELNTAFGTAATVGAGFLAVLDDNGGGTAFFLCGSDGTNWFTVRLTKAL